MGPVGVGEVLRVLYEEVTFRRDLNAQREV